MLGFSFENDHELFAAISAEDIFFTELSRNNFPDMLQNTIPRLVTMGIIDRFEMVDIEHDQAKFKVVPLGVTKFLDKCI